MPDFELVGFTFIHEFDSGNLGKVEFLARSEPEDEDPYYEYNVWTRPDNYGTPYENGNKTWFYFAVRASIPGSTIKLNIQMNKQSKMYGQGMAPVYKIVPGKTGWERIKDRPSFCVNLSENFSNGKFTLTFKHKMPESPKALVYFAFTYPYTYTELQQSLTNAELNIKPTVPGNVKLDELYYHREVLCYSLDHKRIDLITISSHHSITNEREPRLRHLFPDANNPRPFKFLKKVIFLSARVHPGETPSSHVMAGVLNFLITKDDPVAVVLRRHYVFKIIPMLNPDGVYCGNYRTDRKGVNLNRVYLNPSHIEHPSIYGATKVILYHHHGREIEHPSREVIKEGPRLEDAVSDLKLQTKLGTDSSSDKLIDSDTCSLSTNESSLDLNVQDRGRIGMHQMITPPDQSGIFMYGNHFQNIQDNVECMLLPRLISINSQHFCFESCNFSEKNMYIRDKRDGCSREGAGRVALLKMIGLVKSYTLECNYNMGKKINLLPSPVRENLDKRPPMTFITPPKFTPQIYEEVGRAIMGSILDLNGLHPNSRLSNSNFKTLANVKDILRFKAIGDPPCIPLVQTESKKNLKISRVRTERALSRSSRPKKGKTSPSPKTSQSPPGTSRKTIKTNEQGEPTRVKRLAKRSGTSPVWLTRMEKKSGDSSKRLLPEQRRKKLKPK